MYTETFAIMCATILGAAATANTELNRAPPGKIVIEGNDSKTVIVGSGKKALLVAVVDQSADANRVLAEVGKVAELLPQDRDALTRPPAAVDVVDSVLVGTSENPAGRPSGPRLVTVISNA